MGSGVYKRTAKVLALEENLGLHYDTAFVQRLLQHSAATVIQIYNGIVPQ